MAGVLDHFAGDEDFLDAWLLSQRLRPRMIVNERYLAILMRSQKILLAMLVFGGALLPFEGRDFSDVDFLLEFVLIMLKPKNLNVPIGKHTHQILVEGRRFDVPELFRVVQFIHE